MAISLYELSDQLASLVEKAGRAVVQVNARRRLPGSGFIWKDGVVLTANHILERDDQIQVTLDGSTLLPADLVGRDASTDVAVLKLSGAPPDAIQKIVQPARVGSLVLALGRPGKWLQSSFGSITAMGDPYRTGAGGTIDEYIQTSIKMYPGFSGGPLVDMNGAVIGLNTSALQHDDSLTIPAATLERIASELFQHGRIRRGFIGIGTQPIRLPDSIWEEAGQETGLIVTSVEKDSPAEAAGLLIGDVLLGIGNHKTRYVDDLFTSLAGEVIGQDIVIRLYRSGQITQMHITPKERNG